MVCVIYLVCYLDASFYVDVRVPPHNVIRELSNLSSSLLQKHGELWLREMANLTRQCAVTGIAAYTDRVVVSFSKAADALQESKNNEWIPKPVFYAVPRFNNTSCVPCFFYLFIYFILTFTH